MVMYRYLFSTEIGKGVLLTWLQRDRIELEGMTGASEDGSPGERRTHKKQIRYVKGKRAFYSKQSRRADTEQLENMLAAYGGRSAMQQTQKGKYPP